jgi:hypothetical protein
MRDIQTAEEFLDEKVKENDVLVIDVMIEFAKLHVEAALKAASEEVYHNIDIDWVDRYDYSADHNGLTGSIDIDSILNAYPIENIK